MQKRPSAWHYIFFYKEKLKKCYFTIPTLKYSVIGYYLLMVVASAYKIFYFNRNAAEIICAIFFLTKNVKVNQKITGLEKCEGQ